MLDKVLILDIPPNNNLDKAARQFVWIQHKAVYLTFESTPGMTYGGDIRFRWSWKSWASKLHLTQIPQIRMLRGKCCKNVLISTRSENKVNLFKMQDGTHQGADLNKKKSLLQANFSEHFLS